MMKFSPLNHLILRSGRGIHTLWKVESLPVRQHSTRRLQSGQPGRFGRPAVEVDRPHTTRCSTDMSVQPLTHCACDQLWCMGKHPGPQTTGALAGKALRPSRGSESRISQDRTLAAPAVFKGDQTFVVPIGSAEIECPQPMPLSVLDALPQQQVHTSKVVACRI